MTERRERLEIGSARRDELPSVARLAAASLREAWSESGFASLRDQPGALLRVARDATGGVCAFLLAQGVVDELHVLSLAVAPAHRRRGVAGDLLADAIRQREAHHVYLEVRPSNGAARAFYGAQGFAEIGTRRGYYPDGEDAILLAREIGAAVRVRGAHP